MHIVKGLQVSDNMVKGIHYRLYKRVFLVSALKPSLP